MFDGRHNAGAIFQVHRGVDGSADDANADDRRQACAGYPLEACRGA